MQTNKMQTSFAAKGESTDTRKDFSKELTTRASERQNFGKNILVEQ